MSDNVACIHIDGASRGNPGPAAFAYVIQVRDEELIEECGTLGEQTNNVAEYTALVRVLERAATLKLPRLHIHSDSELLVKQMNGEYRVKNADLRDLYDEANQLVRGFQSVRFTHVRREQNRRADELCNKVLDAAKPKTQKEKRVVSNAVMSTDSVRDECIACLDAAKSAWSARDPHAPTVPQVWEQLWSVLEESGLLKKKK